MEENKMPVVILCGGKGSRLSEETIEKPKPMVEIGGKPILWHIMKIYSLYGFNHFILALGYKADYIKNYFYNYRVSSRDFTLSMDAETELQYHNNYDEMKWKITFVDTGLETLKGGRIKRLEEYIKHDYFMMTYGDGVSNININDLVNFHMKHGKIGTLSAVRPPSRFGMIDLDGDIVNTFEEKPQLAEGYINGGFFVFNKKIMEYLSPDVNCDFEFGPMQKLAADGELRAYKHNDFWQCMDTVRDRNYLERLWETNQAKWKLW